MTEIISTKKGILRLLPEEKDVQSAPYKSIFDLTDEELNKIDRWQDMNRGFEDIPMENFEIN